MILGDGGSCQRVRVQAMKEGEIEREMVKYNKRGRGRRIMRTALSNLGISRQEATTIGVAVPQ